MKLHAGDWVIAADSSRCLVLRNDGDAINPELHVLDHESHDNPQSHHQGADRPGRMGAPRTPRSAFAETDFHQLAKTNAAHDLAVRINEWVSSGKVSRLALAADPHTLGQVRAALSPAALSAVVLTLDKDLTHHTVSDIEAHIASA